jgi:outer membrane protein OmpA-like peptidoglycan-associated protein
MPGVVFKGIRPVTSIKVTVVKANGDELEFTKDCLKAGEVWKVTWPQAPGRQMYRVDFSAAGMSDWLTLNFAALVSNPFDITVAPDDIDLAAGRIGYSTTGKVKAVQMYLYAPDDDLIFSQEQSLVLKDGCQKGFEYQVPDREIGLVKLVALEASGFSKEVTFTPYSVPVPHDEVNFEFGKADIRPEEEPKLARVLLETDKALATLGKQIRFKLYVAGYTDTVGSNDANMELSRKRASSIATWLRANGLELAVCSKGFGESVLAKETPDNTPEEANRRTMIVISGQPPYGKDFPGGAPWHCN